MKTILVNAILRILFVCACMLCKYSRPYVPTIFTSVPKTQYPMTIRHIVLIRKSQCLMFVNNIFLIPKWCGWYNSVCWLVCSAATLNLFVCGRRPTARPHTIMSFGFYFLGFRFNLHILLFPFFVTKDQLFLIGFVQICFHKSFIYKYYWDLI